jgi:hypothetical protein
LVALSLCTEAGLSWLAAVLAEAGQALAAKKMRGRLQAAQAAAAASPTAQAPTQPVAARFEFQHPDRLQYVGRGACDFMGITVEAAGWEGLKKEQFLARVLNPTGQGGSLVSLYRPTSNPQNAVLLSKEVDTANLKLWGSAALAKLNWKPDTYANDPDPEIRAIVAAIKRGELVWGNAGEPVPCVVCVARAPQRHAP